MICNAPGPHGTQQPRFRAPRPSCTQGTQQPTPRERRPPGTSQGGQMQSGTLWTRGQGKGSRRGPTATPAAVVKSRKRSRLYQLIIHVAKIGMWSVCDQAGNKRSDMANGHGNKKSDTRSQKEQVVTRTTRGQAWQMFTCTAVKTPMCPSDATAAPAGPQMLAAQGRAGSSARSRGQRRTDMR